MWFPEGHSLRRRRIAGIAIAAALAAAVRAGATSEWMQHAIAGTPVEAALYRMMALPGASVLFPRPPREGILAINKLVAADAAKSSLYALRAREEEQALEFDRAAADWKTYVARSPNHTAALVELANFYERRHAVLEEFETRIAVAEASPSTQDAYTEPPQQRSWSNFERALEIAQEQSFDDARTWGLWQKWMARYPLQPSVYERAFTSELNAGQTAEALAVVAKYRVAFPQDQAFPVKAAALIALHSGGPDSQANALAAYDAAFRPLWPVDLVRSYFSLLASTHRLHAFLSEAKERLASNPDDFDAAARVFLYYRQQADNQQALETLAAYSASKEQRHALWNAQELYTFAQLAASVGAYPEVARYDFALAHTTGTVDGGRDAHEAGLAGIVDALLSAPDQPIALGSGNLSMYRDIATLDQGPGYWNGVLSLWLNSQDPSDAYAAEDAKAMVYFHCAKAAALLAMLDREAPDSPMRDVLHARLQQVYAGYGDDAAVIREGTAFLREFSHSKERTAVALRTADAYAREKNTTAEFAIYDTLLKELARQANNMPLSMAALHSAVAGVPDEAQDNAANSSSPDSGPATSTPQAFALTIAPAQLAPSPAAVEYRQVLERYIGRLTANNQLPQALALLRRELDRNPNDPEMYDRLAQFLQANDLSAQTEEVYRDAIAKFHDDSWYSKLARLYLREKRDSAYAALTREVVGIFSGTELDAWFEHVYGGGPQLALELNLYAHQRFPHDLVFTRNLLAAYGVKPTRNRVAWEKLLRQTWWESPDLTRQFFEFLSSTGRLDAELAAIAPQTDNTAAQQELAEGELWQSHFEASAPLFVSLSEQYPADDEIGTTAADLERSLAWLDPSGPQRKIANAVSIESRLLMAHPDNPDRLARIGDILADHAELSTAGLAPSASYWRRIPELSPGRRYLYLNAATVFWDYFQYDDALQEIALARVHFAQPALFGYEAGAIDESKGDPAQAVHEYVAAVLATGNTEDEYSPARVRLLQLAQKPASAALVDAATTAALDAQTDLRTLRLRVAVLEVQHRSAAAVPLMLAAAAHASTEEEAGEIAAYAQAHAESTVREAALIRQAELTRDSVDKLQLSYELARSYENRNDIADASRVIDTVYRENPKLLGVVRATVDFDWQNNRRPEAIRVLLQAAGEAQPVLAREFIAEASQKANTAGEAQEARQLALSLLQQDPYSAAYIALAADTYTADSSALAQFYRSRLAALGAAAMSPEERKSRTALLRKGLIPALTQTGNYAGAVEQYIALTSAYSDDNALVNEAALYALQYGREQQWLAFLGNATKASPHDSRFFIDLAQSETVFNDPAAAVDAYAHAVAIRKDRTDLYIAKALLEESLQRFDDAAADYLRLYQLTYDDPQWMVALARVRARQGRIEDVIAALKTAYLRGPQPTAHEYFQVASQLEQWNQLDQAKLYAIQGAQAAGDDLLNADGRGIREDDPVVYARILARSGQADAGIALLQAALDSSNGVSSSLRGIVQQVEIKGVLSVTDAQWRAQRAQARQQQASGEFDAALRAICIAANTFYTPEERAVFAQTLEKYRAGASDADLRSRWIPAAHRAQLAALEAQWRTEVLLAKSNNAGGQMYELGMLQRVRMEFHDLADALMRFAQQNATPEERGDAVMQAARSDVKAGDPEAAMRLLRNNVIPSESIPGANELYLNLLLQYAPQELQNAAASTDTPFADAAANLALKSAARPIAMDTIAARGKSLPAVWTKNYEALGGLYLRDDSSAVDTAFRSMLGWDESIGQRIAAPPDPTQQVTGPTWFYDAARYGEWLSLPAQHDDAEDALAADLENSVTAANYMTLAQTYAEAGKLDAALAELGHAKELEPQSAEVEDNLAALLWQTGRKQDAVTAWKQTLQDLRGLEDRQRRVPERFWTEFIAVEQHIAQHKLGATLTPNVDDVIGVYLARNGAYRADELLQAIFAAAPDAKSGAAWLIALASDSKNELDILADIDSADWLPASAQEQMLAQELRLIHNAASEAPQPDDASQAGDTSGWVYQRVSIERRLVALYLDAKQNEQALALLQSLPQHEQQQPDFQRAAAVLAGRDGRLSALLAQYVAQPATAPSPDTLQRAAAGLAEENHLQAARALLEFAFTRARLQHALEPTQYLALAEIRLRTGDINGAVAVLHELVQSGGDLYANLDSAASLLEKNSHPSEALPFLDMLRRGVPWNLTYAVREAEAQIAAKTAASNAAVALIAVAGNRDTAYALRARAAGDLCTLHGVSIPNLGSGELNLLASGSISPAASERPYFVRAREEAAAETSDPATKIKLLREAIAIAPPGSESKAMRVTLFRAYVALNDMPAARATLDEFTAAQGFWPQPTNDPEQAQQGEDSTDEPPDLLDETATVYLATGDRVEALATLQREKATLHESSQIATVQSRIDSLVAVDQTDAANAMRRPLIRRALDQPVIVRARLDHVPQDAFQNSSAQEGP